MQMFLKRTLSLVSRKRRDGNPKSSWIQKTAQNIWRAIVYVSAWQNMPSCTKRHLQVLGTGGIGMKKDHRGMVLIQFWMIHTFGSLHSSGDLSIPVHWCFRSSFYWRAKLVDQIVVQFVSSKVRRTMENPTFSCYVSTALNTYAPLVSYSTYGSPNSVHVERQMRGGHADTLHRVHTYGL